MGIGTLDCPDACRITLMLSSIVGVILGDTRSLAYSSLDNTIPEDSPYPILSHSLPNMSKLSTAKTMPASWVAVKELKLSYYIGETLLFTLYIPLMVT